MSTVKIESSWRDKLVEVFGQPYMAELRDFLKKEKAAAKVIYPPAPQIFRAFDLTPFEEVKVVILGQDPYHGPKQAHGLSFSVPETTPFPPSLQNIFKELKEDLGCVPPKSGDLTSWAKQGVLLLNSVLTVEGGQASSHQGKGWERFTDHVISLLNQEREHLVFILWGSYAQQKGKIIDPKKHLVIKSAHPSPLSAYRGFFGSKPFSQANEYLKTHGISPIRWT